MMIVLFPHRSNSFLMSPCACHTCEYYVFVCVCVMPPFSPNVHNSKLSVFLPEPDLSKCVHHTSTLFAHIQSAGEATAWLVWASKC